MYRFLIVLTLIVGCAHGEDSTRTAHGLAASSGNAAAIRSLLRAPLGYGGIWFPDATCRRHFPEMGIISDDAGLDALAKCIAQLPLTASTRKITDGAIVTYAPGFELEVRTYTMRGGTWIRWIGYVSRRAFADSHPTIDPAVLESLRIAGERYPAIDDDASAKLQKELASTKLVATAWFKVCIDETGAVSDVYPRQTTSPIAEKVFRASIDGWRFRPFMVGQAPMKVCSVLELVHPRERADDEIALPMGLPITSDGLSTLSGSILGPLVEGNRTIVPSEGERRSLARMGIDYVHTSVRYCIDQTGAVTGLTLVEPSGLPDFDRELQREIGRWRHKPYLVEGVPTPVCATAFFIYHQKSR